MKRMSEVFELPINGARLERKILEAHFCTEEDHAAHAINHVDALADALESVVEMAWLISDDSGDEFSARPEIIVAQKALAAYRGGK